jgi:hypothetical protein
MDVSWNLPPSAPVSGSPSPRGGLGPAALLALLATLVAWRLAPAQEERSAGGVAPAARKSRELWFFFAPSQKNLREEVRAIGAFLIKHPELKFRPCLLAGDWDPIRKPSADFAGTIEELRTLGGPSFSLPVWDDEGLARARELGVDRLPAVALLDAPDKPGARRAHLAVGRGVNLEELFSCTK